MLRALALGAGFALLAVAVVLLFLPGPSLPPALLGLGLLAPQVGWAARLRERLLRAGGKLRHALFPPREPEARS